MSEYTNLLFEKNNGIGVITINRLQSLNALNAATLCELGILCDVLSNDDSVKVVIITGAGEKAFVAGADINAMLPLTAMEGRAYGKTGQSVFNKIENLPQVVIAAVNGFALGGGCELALACDIRIATEKAKFGQPEVSLGITPGFGGTQRLPRLIGMGIAKELIYTGEIIDATEAYRLGLVNKVVPAEAMMETAMNLARKIMAKASIAVQLSKVAINQGINMDLVSGIANEAEVFGLCFSTEDQKEGMSAFIEKRKPIFTGK